MSYDARLATDIGLHAGQEALKAIIRICDTMGTDAERTSAAIAAFTYLVSISMGMKLLGDDVYAKMLEAANELHAIDPNFKKAMESINAKE